MLDRFRRFFNSPIFDDEEKNRIARILNSFGWSAIGVVFIITMFRLIMGEWLNGSSNFVLLFIILILVGMQVIIRYGYVWGAGRFLVTAAWLAMTYQAWQANGIRDAAAISYLVIILLAGLLLGWREGLFISALSIAVLWHFAFQEQHGLRLYQADSPLSFARDLTAVFILANVLIYLLIHSLNHFLYNARLELRERLRTDEKLQIQTQYLTALHETALGLVNRLELNPLLELILTRVSELLDTPHVGIDLLLPDASALKQELGYGVFLEYNGTIAHKSVGLIGKVWESGKTILTQDYNEWDGHNPEALGLGFGAVLGTPLKSGTKVVGVLTATYTDKQKKFTPEQVTSLERLAALASLAIDNARLYERAQKEIQERKMIEQALRSSDELFRKVFNNNNIAISIVTLEEGIFLEANAAFWELTGLYPEHTIGHSTLEFDLWQHSEERAVFVQELLKKRSLQDVHVEFPKENQPTKTSIGYYELININARTRDNLG